MVEKEYCSLYEKELQKVAGILNTGQEEKNPFSVIPAEENQAMVEFLATIKTTIGTQSFNSWFKDLRYKRTADKTVIIKSKTRFIAEYIKNHWYAEIQQAIKTCFPSANDFSFQY